MCNHEHEHTHCYHHHHHHSNAFFGKHAELYFAILSGVFLAIGYALSFTSFLSQSSTIFIYIISFFFGSFFTIQEAFSKLLKGKFEIDFLMIVAACGAAFLGKWIEGALLLFLFSLGHALEHYALGRAQNAISNLGKLTPSTALVKREGTFVQVAIKDLKIGDVVLVKAHEQIAADGIVVSGSSAVNQSPITGESMPVDKVAYLGNSNDKFENIAEEHRVFAGTLNGSSPLEIRVLRISTDSTVARMIQMVSEAQAKQSPTQRFTKRIEKYYVPAVLILVIVLCFVFLWGMESFSESFYRAITVLVASSPCALAISTPGTVLSGIARGAQKGVLFKGGGALEDLGSVKGIAFDKTGTLTEGKPKVVEVIAHEITTTELLRLSMSLEVSSNHPLALAIVEYAKQFTDFAKVAQNDVHVTEGKGIEGIIENQKLYLGSLSFLPIEPPRSLHDKLKQLENEGYTLVGLSSESQFLGSIALFDKPKSAAADMLRSLRKIGVEQLIMLTGDRQSVAETIGKELGIKQTLGNLLPEDKVSAIEDLNARYEKTAMIGDGVNDAPAMASSTVAVAMGAAGSDVALETADIALLSDNIKQIPFAVGLSRKAKKIIKQNLYISLGSIALLIPMAIFNITGIGATVVLHEGTTILVILNALRLLSYNFSPDTSK